MGGHALQDGMTRRYSAHEYHRLIPLVEAQVYRSLRTSECGPAVSIIPSLRAKESFGDMDVLVESSKLPTDWVERIRADFRPNEMVKNGPVLSFDYRELQIDLILAPGDEFGFSRAYFSWGDTGNLIGRIAHKMGLKFGHDGLWLPYRDGDYLFREILVTRDFQDALRFLGFNASRWDAGFDTQEDVYQFIAAGEYFDPTIYQLENRTSRDRVRDRKRPMYSGFLEWAEKNASAHFTAWPSDKRDWLPDVFKIFQNTRIHYEQAQSDLARQKAVRAKFDGNLIGKATGLSGKALGELMREIKSSFSSGMEFEQFMLDSSEADVAKLAQQFAIDN